MLMARGIEGWIDNKTAVVVLEISYLSCFLYFSKG